MRVTPPSPSASTLARSSARACEARPARQRLDRQRSRASEKVDHPLARDVARVAMLQNVEDRFAQPL